MSKLVKGGLIVGGLAAIWLLFKGMSLKRSEELLSVKPTNLHEIGFGDSGLGKYLKFKIDIQFENISKDSFKLVVPGVRLFYNNSQIGSKIPDSKETVIQPRAISTISGMEFRVQIVDLINKGILADIFGNTGKLSDLVKKFSYYILAEVNGTTIEFNETLA